MEIEILCKKLIKPCLPTPPHLQRYKLSFFDQIFEKEHVPIVLFYANNNFINNSTIDKRVEQSFSKVLTHVYPAARRYDKDECSILCLDQGISYTKAKVNYKLYNFLEKARKDLSLAALFWPHENKYINKTNLMVSPIVTAQVIEFECGGLAVSLSSSHPAMDGFSNIKFLFEWAKVCKMDTPVEKINFLSFNLGNVFRTRDISRLFKSTYDSIIEKNIIVKRFVINEAVMLRLRKKCIEESSGALTFQPSRVEIITALLWRAYIRASATINGKDQEGIAQLHNINQDAMNKVVASCTKASPDEIVSTVINTYNESFEAPKWGGNDGVDKVVCSSLCNFPFHDTDFGLEKPTLLFFGMKDIQMFWLYDTDIHSEVGVQVDLKESYMQLFECDDDIKAFTFIHNANL